ncbi:hypothetical protein W02_09660 [Nitrospira sp. KM1]|nr:hypothetical protein W02_09660 [Nitrospira sp. KM1]
MQIGPRQDMKRLRLWISPIAGWLIRITPTCKDMTELLSHAMDRPLPLGIRLRMRLHFLICKWCERYKQQLLFLRQAVRRRPEMLHSQTDNVAHQLSSDAKDRLKQALLQK